MCSLWWIRCARPSAESWGMMKKIAMLVVPLVLLGVGLGGCAIPNAVGKTAAGVVKTTGKAVKAVGKGVKNAVD